MSLPGAYTSGNIPADGARYRGAKDIRPFTVAASSDFIAGELVILSSGSVTQMDTLPGSNNSVSSSLSAGTLMLGMALDNASGNSTVMCVVAGDDTEFLLRVYNSTATDAELRDVNVGDFAEVFRYRGSGATDVQTVVSAAPNGTAGINKIVITEKPSDRSATDQYPAVWGKVRDTLRAL